MQNTTRLRGSAALRQGRRSIAGQTYLVTFITHRRRRLFDDSALAMVASRATEDGRLWTSSRLLAWVLMPDHWHGIVVVGARDNLPRVVQRLKSNTARVVRDTRADIGKVWALGYHDHALRPGEAPMETARYGVRNPVAAGLVTRVGDYPFWNAVWL